MKESWIYLEEHIIEKNGYSSMMYVRDEKVEKTMTLPAKRRLMDKVVKV